MSSDDSCIEDGREFFLARKLPHRHDVEIMLKGIDDHHNIQKKAACRKGARLITRIRGAHAKDTRRGPFKGKTKDCYAPRWLERQTTKVVEGLEMKKNTFKWISLE